MRKSQETFIITEDSKRSRAITELDEIKTFVASLTDPHDTPFLAGDVILIRPYISIMEQSVGSESGFRYELFSNYKRIVDGQIDGIKKARALGNRTRAMANKVMENSLPQ